MTKLSKASRTKPLGQSLWNRVCGIESVGKNLSEQEPLGKEPSGLKHLGTSTSGERAFRGRILEVLSIFLKDNKQ